MVDVQEIQKLLNKHFKITGMVTIDPITGVVDVDGEVALRSTITQLPVKFGQVRGSFDCSSKQLTTLDGSPSHVGQDFDCSNNLLSTLEGAPDHVGRDFYSLNLALSTLDHLPSLVGSGFWISYSRSLPLLRLLQYNNNALIGAPEGVDQILTKYAGTGKKGMLGAGVELAKLGYKENARW
jgi:hypothetical protein